MKKLFILFVIACAGLTVNAQEYHWRLNYNVNIPIGEFSDNYIQNVSWRGVSVDNRWMISERLSAGVYFNWITFYEKRSNILGTSEDGNISAFGTQFRYLNSWAFQANAHYYLGEQGQINPWIGAAVGTAYNVQRTELGFLAYIYKPWSFALTPQIGVDIPISISTDFTLSASYNLYLNSENKAPLDYTFIGINAGFKFTPF